MQFKNATFEHTTDGITNIVPVRRFRQMTDGALDAINRRHACTDAHELAQWAGDLRMVVANLKATGCKRATREDWDWREKALDRSAEALIAAGV